MRDLPVKAAEFLRVQIWRRHFAGVMPHALANTLVKGAWSDNPHPRSGRDIRIGSNWNLPTENETACPDSL